MAEPWYVLLLAIPLWFGPPILLIFLVARPRPVRIALGVGLAAALAFLFGVAFQLLQGRGLPTWIDALILWGPITLAACGVAYLIDRWRSRRGYSRAVLPSRDAGQEPVVRRLLTGAIAAWSLMCACCVFSPAAKFVDLRLNSPRAGLMLPMPADLTLISADRKLRLGRVL
jgi:hypothetical protein